MTTTAELPGPAMPAGRQIDVFYLPGGHTEPSSPPRSSEAMAARLQGLERQRARDAAEEAELIMCLAAARPATDDPAPGTPGARKPGWVVDEVDGGISEFFLAELSAVLNLGRGTAAYRYRRAHTWTTKLPLTLAALRAGELDERRAAELAKVLEHTNAEIAGQVEASVIGEANDLSVARLNARATEEMLRLDSAAADERRKAAEKNADVHLYPSATDGRSTVAADLPTDEAVECVDVVDQIARMLKADGDERPIGALRAHVLSMLIRRPADSGLPAVCANLTATASIDALAGTSSTPGEVNGLPITAAHVRELFARVGALGLTTPDGGELTFAITGPNGELLATLTPAELAKLGRRFGRRAGARREPASGGGHGGPSSTHPPTGNAPSCRPATGGAGSPTAASASAGPTWTTSSHTPAAGRRTAPTSAACAAATTDSRHSPAAGTSGWTTTEPCTSPHHRASPAPPDHRACGLRTRDHRQNRHRQNETTIRPSRAARNRINIRADCR